MFLCFSKQLVDQILPGSLNRHVELSCVICCSRKKAAETLRKKPGFHAVSVSCHDFVRPNTVGITRLDGLSGLS